MLAASPLSPALHKRPQLSTLAAFSGDGHRYVTASDELLACRVGYSDSPPGTKGRVRWQFSTCGCSADLVERGFSYNNHEKFIEKNPYGVGCSRPERLGARTERCADSIQRSHHRAVTS